MALLHGFIKPIMGFLKKADIKDTQILYSLKIRNNELSKQNSSLSIRFIILP